MLWRKAHTHFALLGDLYHGSPATDRATAPAVFRRAVGSLCGGSMAWLLGGPGRQPPQWEGLVGREADVHLDHVLLPGESSDKACNVHDVADGMSLHGSQ